MSTEQQNALIDNHKSAKKPRSDKGKKRVTNTAEVALPSVLAALKGLGKDEIDRVLHTAMTFYQLDEPEAK